MTEMAREFGYRQARGGAWGQEGCGLLARGVLIWFQADRQSDRKKPCDENRPTEFRNEFAYRFAPVISVPQAMQDRI